MIKGIDVTLHQKTETGTDPFGHPTYEETDVIVSNVLVAPVTNEDAINELNLSGKHVVYELALPKGDDHDWVNTTVSFWGETFRTVGVPVGGIEAMIPLQWNKKSRWRDMSKVKVWIEPSGMNELRNSEEMKQVLQEYASQVSKRAGDGYTSSVKSAPTRAVATVRADSPKAVRDNFKNNTLLRALG